jgi:predicted MPP superfamily phosphohydrolase
VQADRRDVVSEGAKRSCASMQQTDEPCSIIGTLAEVKVHVAYSDEWVIILTFIGAFIALYTAAGFLLARRFFSPPERTPHIGPTGKFVLLLATCGIAMAAYAFFVEPYWLEVTHVTVPIDGLPPTKPPIRIAQISDLHSDAAERLEGEVPEVIRKEHPDLIFFTGDAINSRDGFANFYKCIKRVQEIAPLVSIKGDWDFDPKMGGPFERAGLINPDASATPQFTIRGAKFCVVCVSSGADARAVLNTAPKNMPTILLTHGPDSNVVQNCDTHGVDLICCGHTHGGQIALPGYGALITQSRTKREYASGMHKVLNTPIYTNRGLGMEGHFPRVRFFARPEITIFELVPSGKPRTQQKRDKFGA